MCQLPLVLSTVVLQVGELLFRVNYGDSRHSATCLYVQSITDYHAITWYNMV